jgi:hypothetical protein
MPSPAELKYIAEAHEAELRRAAVISLAKALPYVRDGECEVDDTAQLSEGDDNGVYVQAWVWVDFANTPFDKGLG